MVFLFALIEELVRPRDLKFALGVENGLSRKKFKYLSKILNIVVVYMIFHILACYFIGTCYCMEQI